MVNTFVRYILIFSALGLASCNDTSKHDSKTSEKESPIVQTTKRARTIPPLTLRKEHLFSNATNPDIFSLDIIGDSIISGKAILKILNFENELLFKDSFPAADFLYDAYDVIPTNAEREDTIVSRFKAFLDNRWFLTPAGIISSEMDPELNLEDKEIWKEIKSDSSITGFVYSHGYEGTYAIAFSKKKKKVVFYFTAD